MTQLPELTHPAVRDLEWVFSSPELVHSPQGVPVEWCQKTVAAHHETLLALDRDPSRLLKHLEPSLAHPRLGVYFEALVSFWLKEILHAEPVHSNVPLRLEGQSIGEFDLLFRLPDGKPRHWELAVKFYLHFEDLYYGPNAQDRLDLKLARLHNHQLTLSRDSRAADLLTGLELSQPEPELLLKGRLFEHGTENPFWWIRLEDEWPLAWNSRPSTRWLILPRKRWLAPARSLDLPPLTGEALREFAREGLKQNRAIHVAEMTEGRDGVWRERSRGFLVDLTWPQKMTHSAKT